MPREALPSARSLPRWAVLGEAARGRCRTHPARAQPHGCCVPVSYLELGPRALTKAGDVPGCAAETWAEGSCRRCPRGPCVPCPLPASTARRLPCFPQPMLGEARHGFPPKSWHVPRRRWRPQARCQRPTRCSCSSWPSAACPELRGQGAGRRWVKAARCLEAGAAGATGLV